MSHFIVLCTLFGCSNGFSEASPKDAASSDGTSTVEPDAGAAEASAPFDATAHDAAIDAGIDSSTKDDCTAPPVAAAAYVSRNGSGATCSSSAPCATIGAGITAAVGSHWSDVYVDTGTFVETVALAAGITVHGGWNFANQTWQRICGSAYATSTVVRAPDGNDRTIVATDLAGSAAIEALVVNGQSAAPTPSQSAFGVFATGRTTTLTLTDVTIQVGNGGAGADGVAGTDGTTSSGAACTATPTVPTGSGNNGTAATIGTFAATGFAPGDGGNGIDGAEGPAGAPGMGEIIYGTVCRTLSGFCAAPIVGTTIPVSTSHGGAAGCGGFGGTAGSGGRGGGSSVGLFIFGAAVNATGGSFTAGNGGNGGNGAKGGKGGAATPGGEGEPGDLILTACQVTDATCVPATDGRATYTDGTDGTAGTNGGSGAGGAGGDSFAYYVDPSATFSFTGTTFAHGAAGAGGQGAAGTAAPSGPAGLASDHN